MNHPTARRRLFLAMTVVGLTVGCSPEATPASHQPDSLGHRSQASAGSEWQPTGRLALARLTHASVRLKDGKVLTVGGYNRTAELYGPGTGTWTRIADTHDTHRGATATLLPSGKVLLVGGESNWRNGAPAEIYDPNINAWSVTDASLTPRLDHTATLLDDGRVLITGGSDATYGVAMASAELYDPSTGAWTAAAPMLSARSHHTATLLKNGQVLVAGGTGLDGMPQRAAELFDPTTHAWRTVEAMAEVRAFHSATLLPSGLVLVVGGGGGDWNSSASTEVFDPSGLNWTTTGTLHLPRRYHSTTILADGRALVAGGYHELTGIVTASEVYDSKSHSWILAGTMGTGRYQHTATLLTGGQVLVAGGHSTGDQASAELYTPPPSKQGPYLTLESGSASLEIIQNQQQNTTSVLSLRQEGGQSLRLLNETIVSPAQDGLQIISDFPKNGYSANGAIALVVNQSVKGIIPGIYQVTNRASVAGTSIQASNTFTVRVHPSGGTPVVLPLGAWPDGLPANASTEVTFTSAIASFSTPPAHLLLRRLEGASEPVVAFMRDDGLNGDLMAGDGVYSTKIRVNSGAEGLLRYKATATHPSGSGETSSTPLDLSVSCHPIRFQPYSSARIVTDPANGTRLLCDEVLVSFVDGTACGETSALIERLLGPGAAIIGGQPGLKYYQVHLPGACSANTVTEAVRVLKQDARIRQATPNFVGQADEFIPNDPLSAAQYATQKIRAEEAWVIARGGSVVAVIDSGIDTTHADLLGQVLPGIDIFDNDEDASDDFGHGTNVASIIAAKGNNAEGMAGVAWGSKLLPVKAMSGEGAISTGTGAAAIKYAADKGAKVINCSWGFKDRGRPVDTSILQEAVAYAIQKGSLVVASSGNEGDTRKSYPCAYPNVLCVAATTANDTRWSMSNYGNHVSLVAPGVNITVARKGGGYETQTGTSFAAAWVSGSASVVWSHKPSWTEEQIRQRLMNTATGLPLPGMGRGRIDLFEAVFNGSFEDGINGWTVRGTAGALGSMGTILPTDNAQLAFVSSGPDDAQIETTLEQGFTVQPGVTKIPMKFDYNFVTEEYPEWINTQYNDNIRIVLVGPTGKETLLAYEEVNSAWFSLIPELDFPGGDLTVGATGWKSVSVQIPVTSGPGKYSIRVRDEGDGVYDSNLLIDNIRFK
ncbi:S8 family serine peptidase [Melittangium boletus]|uniref:Peptidase S8/S53 domain-containing protein n=1 Tax=Melittangium boletus DSM 14713 TaxID=1294270 RepID=A0A250I8P2_9BACT|nr:S8 family serine peptidase [Melittangium boletus]ATB27541.1 hypothetical protein MEBOL_000984 [Melittangium boletus DSM 14713]